MEDHIRQLLITEIERLFIEQGEDESTIRSLWMISTKYPFLSKLFEDYSVTPEDWERLVRDALFYTRNDVRYMYQRTMQIVRRFKELTSNYFEVKSPLGTYLIPDRLSDLNRLFELYDDFFSNIYPGIINKFNINALTAERDSALLSGKVNWNKTILKKLPIGTTDIPLSFVTSISESSLETPENMLLLSYIIRMQIDAKLLEGHNFEVPLNSEEIFILSRIFHGCSSIVKTTILQHMIQKALEYANLSIYDPQLLNLESTVLGRLRDGLIRQKGYRLLLEWISKYRELNIRIVSPNHTNFPLEKIRGLDTMFELWILFEILDHLSINLGATIIKSSSLDRFTINMNDITFDFCYQPAYQGWSLKGVPDYAIEVNGKSEVIMDAKNWTERKDDAIYKMLGYLNNFDGRVGILFFPNSTSIDNRFISKGEELRNHSNQLMFNCVLPLSGQNKIEHKKVALDNLIEIIRDNI